MSTPDHPMSKTAAKRQAHRESCIYRPEGGLWSLWVAPGLHRVVAGGLAYSNARRALAAWRAERVRELMGVLSCTCGGSERDRDVHREHCPLFQDPSRAAWHAKSV